MSRQDSQVHRAPLRNFLARKGWPRSPTPLTRSIGWRGRLFSFGCRKFGWEPIPGWLHFLPQTLRARHGDFYYDRGTNCSFTGLNFLVKPHAPLRATITAFIMTVLLIQWDVVEKDLFLSFFFSPFSPSSTLSFCISHLFSSFLLLFSFFLLFFFFFFFFFFFIFINIHLPVCIYFHPFNAPLSRV
jgi:hypothetical protein